MGVFVYLLSLLVITPLLAEAWSDKCLYLVTLENGYVKYKDADKCNAVGAYVEFGCDKGFELDGVKETVCQANLEWKDPIPKCEDKRCPAISGLQDGTMSNYCRENGCVVSFSCDAAYKLNGYDKITCVDGTWNWDPPKCDPNWCDPIKTFDHGYLQNYKNPPLPGTKVTIKCDIGFSVTGPSTAECKADLKWTTFGKCECDDIYPGSCDLAKNNCPHIISLPFGFHDGDKNTPGSWVKFTGCMDGYTRSGPGSVKCVSGKWGELPICKYARCPHTEAIEGGWVAPTVKYGLHDHIYYYCHDGYTIKGPKRLRCKENRYWGPGTTVCKKMECPDILTFKYGKIMNYSTKLHDYITFKCDPGFILVGEATNRCGCDENGIAWKFPIPKCVPEKQCKSGDIKIDDKCYRYFKDLKIFLKAWDECFFLNGSLAVMTEAKIVEKLQGFVPRDTALAWIGHIQTKPDLEKGLTVVTGFNINGGAAIHQAMLPCTKKHYDNTTKTTCFELCLSGLISGCVAMDTRSNWHIMSCGVKLPWICQVPPEKIVYERGNGEK